MPPHYSNAELFFDPESAIRRWIAETWNEWLRDVDRGRCSLKKGCNFCIPKKGFTKRNIRMLIFLTNLRGQNEVEIKQFKHNNMFWYDVIIYPEEEEESPIIC